MEEELVADEGVDAEKEPRPDWAWDPPEELHRGWVFCCSASSSKARYSAAFSGLFHLFCGLMYNLGERGRP